MSAKEAAAYQRARRERLLEEGRCVKCADADAEPERTFCVACLQYHRVYRAARRAEEQKEIRSLRGEIARECLEEWVEKFILHHWRRGKEA